MPLGCIKGCGVEPGDQERQPRHRQKLQQERFVVDHRHGPCQRTGHKPEAHAAQGLNGPSGIEEGGVVASFALHDGGADANVGELHEALDDDGYNGHQAEGFGEEEAGQDEVRCKAQDLRPAKARDGAQSACQEPVTREYRPDLLHSALSALLSLARDLRLFDGL